MSTPKSHTSRKALIFLILFVIPFLLGGLLSGARLVSTVTSYFKIQSWEEVPATIVHIDLGCGLEGTIEYRYRYQDKNHTANRVHLEGVDFLTKNTIRELREHQKSGQPVPCYVDPDQPDSAILYRNFPWQMAFLLGPCMLLFGGFGLAMLIASFVFVQLAKKEEHLTQAHPNKPWMWKPAWAEGRISTSAKSLIGPILLAGVWTLFCLPLVPFALLNDAAWGNADQLLWRWGAIVFVLVGFCLIGGVAIMVIRQRKYGRSVFEIASVPGVIGGQLAGVIHCSRKIHPQENFRLTLSCIQTTHDDEGSNHILWENEQLLDHDLLQNDPNRMAIPVLFPIPYECCSTGKETPTTEKKSLTTGKKKNTTKRKNSRNTIAWYLEVKAKTSGLDYRVKFEVPVFKTPQSDPHFTVDHDLIAQYTAPEDPQRDLQDAGVIRTTSPDGNADRFCFPMAREPKSASVFTGGATLFAVVPFLLIYFNFGWVAIFFSILSVLASLLLGVLSLDLWFYRSVIDISPRGLTIIAGLFGYGRRSTIEAGQIAKIKKTSNLQNEKQKFYDIVIVCKNGKRVTAAKRISGNRLTTSLIRQIEQSLVGRGSL